MDPRNEIAGVLAIGAFVAVALVLAGTATLVRAALGAGGSAVLGAVATTVGLAGLFGVWAVVASGYFGTAPARAAPAADGAETEGERDPA